MKKSAAPQSSRAPLNAIRRILNSRSSRDEKLLAVCHYLKTNIEDFDWVGFYLSDHKCRELVLGPFAGAPTEHVRIPFGRGVCGQAAVTLDTINIADVSAESNYLACSLDVRSEIVIPIIKNGTFLGELDIDSHRPARFGNAERALLEAIAKKVIDLF